MTSTGIHMIGPKAEALIVDSDNETFDQLRKWVMSSESEATTEGVLSAISESGGDLCARVERGLVVEYFTIKNGREYSALQEGADVKYVRPLGNVGLISTALAPHSHYRLSIVHQSATPFEEGSR